MSIKTFRKKLLVGAYSCKTCSIQFDSKVARTFCSVKCRAADPEFRAVLTANLSKPKERNGPLPAGIVQPCVSCSKEIYLTATDRKRGKKACSRSCWRAWLADRFDRAIAQVQTINAVTGYDAFLSQDKLTCLVDGCVWSGADLSLHCNMAHGITAEKLKELAGFNRNTGVVSGPLARLYESRGNVGTIHSLKSAREAAKKPRKAQPARAESIEHYRKAMALRGAFTS